MAGSNSTRATADKHFTEAGRIVNDLDGLMGTSNVIGDDKAALAILEKARELLALVEESTEPVAARCA